MKMSFRQRKVLPMWWGVCLVALSVMSLVGCGGGGGGGGNLLTLSGDVTVPGGTSRQAMGGYALANATVKAYAWPNLTDAIAQGTTDSNGHYVLTLPESAAGKDIVVIATKQVGDKMVRVATVSPDVPAEGRSNVNLDAVTTFALEEIARIREQEGLSDLSPGGVATVMERIREQLGDWNGDLTTVLPSQIGGGLREEGLQTTIQNIVQQHKGALKGSTGNPDVDRARSMMQTMRDMMGTVVGNGRDEGTAIEDALNMTQQALDAQLAATEAFGERFDVMMNMLGMLDEQPPGEYRLYRDQWGYLRIERTGDIEGGKTWKVTSQVEGASSGLVLTVTTEQPLGVYRFDPAAGKYTITATKSGVNYSATLTPTINEANRTIQFNASINLQDNALSQAITFNGTLLATMAQMPSGDAPPQITSVSFNGQLNSQYGSAQVTNLRAEFDPDASQEDSLKRITLQSLQAQITARPFSLSLQGVDIPFMKLNGGGTAPTSVTINTLQITGRDKNNAQMSLTISEVSATLVEYRDPVNGMGSGVIKTLQGKIAFASGRLSLNGEVDGTWNNPLPFSQIPDAGNRLSTFPEGNIRIRGNMTPAIGKPAAVDITIASTPKASPPKVTVSAAFSYGNESMQTSVEMVLAEYPDGVHPASGTISMSHSPSGMRIQVTGGDNQPVSGAIRKSDGTKVADIGEAIELGIQELGHAGIVKYVDGTFETLESLLPK
ncbi:MAG: hypothetical protein KatS3mg023_0289 [Armatimonadota bacterium]|nr:MAG: hypothetical protein KatS3mg023_0289 [Armatimonadota bacterium]